MPWTPKSFWKHNHAATPHAKAVGAKIANHILQNTGNEGRAIREANAAINRMHNGKRK
jgi:hypothetical protein